MWERLVLESGARVLLHATAFAVRADRHGRVGEVDVLTRGGTRTVRAAAVVDASGDADVCHLAGAPYEAPARTGDGPVQSLSTVFRMAGVDVDRAEAVPKDELWRRMREAAAAGEFALPRLEGSFHRTPQPGVVMALMTRMRDVDATDPDQLTAAEIEGRRQCAEYLRFLRGHVPGFERAVLVSTSPAVGVCESRRVVGDHVLTAAEVFGATAFPDQIARCGAPVEDHHAGADTRWAHLPEGETYGIPYRALLPREVEGLVVAGRCFSATHDAHASARSMATCMAMGQAAGTAAALAAAAGTAPRALDPQALRTRLTADGADVGPLAAAPAVTASGA